MNAHTSPEQQFTPGLTFRGIDVPQRLSDYRLIAFDMDSTLINIECIDEVADAAGRKAEVAAITEAAMRGEIADYKESLRRRSPCWPVCRHMRWKRCTSSGCASIRARANWCRPVRRRGCVPCS
jgi:hypothetical protein